MGKYTITLEGTEPSRERRSITILMLLQGRGGVNRFDSDRRYIALAFPTLAEEEGSLAVAPARSLTEPHGAITRVRFCASSSSSSRQSMPLSSQSQCSYQRASTPTSRP